MTETRALSVYFKTRSVPKCSYDISFELAELFEDQRQTRGIATGISSQQVATALQ